MSPTACAENELSLNEDEGTRDDVERTKYPVMGLLPKQETQAWEFLCEHAEYDGRGVKVAILDTGVDPAASGLQTCPDGRPKILDIVDCTGSGDVDTSTVIKGDAVRLQDGCISIEGLTGRRLKLNPKWSNPSGEWRIGIKRAYELFPSMLMTRVSAERKKKWMIKHLEAEATVAREISAWKEVHPNPLPGDKKYLQDLEFRAAFLSDCKNDYEDPGPLHDCVVWKGYASNEPDGRDEAERWWAAIDMAESGDLSDAVALTDFDHLRQHGRFSDMACLNYGVHIYDEGDVLSIVVDAGAHGTHVAGIVGAYYEDDPEASGVAPGAQIVSLKIGDSRLGSMETGTGVVRAINEAVKRGCQVINMSYGEAAALCDSGRAIQVARDAILKHRTIFVASAGNNGPALSTSGTPGGTSPDILSVGAYASPSLMSASFSIRENLEGGNFTWTSAGPTADGDIGVCVMAPGGAIAPVPNWTLQKKQLMIGTSMASPNCAGVVALLLSGFKQKFPDVKMSAHRMRRALENTAKRLSDLETVVQGRGLVQVKAAFEHLERHGMDEGEDVQLKVTVDGKRGVYLRNSEEVSKEKTWSVSVKPLLHDDEPNDKRAAFEMRLRLTCHEDWVKCSSDLELLHSGRNFVIAVDPTQLSPGLHFTEIEGYDTGAPSKGPVFRVPITALVPSKPVFTAVPRGGLTATLINPEDPVQEVGNVESKGSGFGPGKVIRRFLHPPLGASWMDLEVKDCRDVVKSPDGTRRLMVLHCIQLLPHTPYRNAESQNYYNMHPGQKEVSSMRLAASAGIEVCIAQNWNAVGSTKVEINVTFRGITPCPDTIAMSGGSSHAQINVSSPLGMEEVHPTATLTKWWSQVLPSKALITALGDRHAAPDGKQCYALLLEYSFKQTDASEVTPRFAAVNGYLYENAYESQMYMVFDANKKLLGVGDCWPEAVKCQKGEHVVRLQIRHPDQSMLKRLKGHPLSLMRTLGNGTKHGGKEITLSVHSSMIDLSTSAKAPGPLWLDKGQARSYFFAEPHPDKLPKGVKPGDVFTGTATFVRRRNGVSGEGRIPGRYDVIFTAGPTKSNSSSQDSISVSTSSTGNGSTSGKNEDGSTNGTTEVEKMLDALRDVRIKHLNSCQCKKVDAFQELYETVKEQIRAEGRTNPDGHVPLLMARLHFLDRDSIRKGDSSAIIPPESQSESTLRSTSEGGGASTETSAATISDDKAFTTSNEGSSGNTGESIIGKVAGTIGLGSPAKDEVPPKEASRTLEETVASLRRVVTAADDVVDHLDKVEVAQHFGTNVDVEDQTLVAARKEFDEKKKHLIDALTRKTRALAEIEELSGETATSKGNSVFLASYSELLSWVDVAEDKYVRVTLPFLRRKKRLGMAVKLLNKLMCATSKIMSRDEACVLRSEVFLELGWDHLAEGDKRWAVIGNPKSYALF